MIIGDKNCKLLITEQSATIIRTHSTIKYDKDYISSIQPVVLEMPKVFKNKIYDCVNNKLILIQTNEQKDLPKGNTIVDFYKIEKDFYFIRKMGEYKILCNILDETLLKFNSIYLFEGSNLYFFKDNKLYCFNITKKEESEIKTPFKTSNLALFTCKNETIAFADQQNKILIFNQNNKISDSNQEKHRTYHWMSKKIVFLEIYDNYVIAISKIGNVARFHIKLQKIEPLFTFNGDFVDCVCINNKIYLLTNFEFIVFDLITGNIEFKELLVGNAIYKSTFLESFKNIKNDNDIFNIKRKSSIEIPNIIQDNSIKMVPKNYITYFIDNYLFIYDPSVNKIVSLFRFDKNTKNFVCFDRCYSFIQRKSNLIILTYKIFYDKIVQIKTQDLSWKGDFTIEEVFSVKNEIYLRILQSIYKINKMGVLEKIYECKNIKLLKNLNDEYLCTVDEKGIYNVISEKYDIIQKKITNFCIFNKQYIFFIEDMGIFSDINTEREICLKIKGIIDMKQKDKSNIIEILRFNEEGKYVIAEYCHEENEFKILGEEVVVEPQSNRLLSGRVSASSKSDILLN